MDQTEHDLVKLIEWLLAATEQGISPDAYVLILKVTNSVVLRVFRRSAQPHEAEIVDLGIAVGITCARRRPETRYGLFFLREALVFREETSAQPILPSSPQPTLQMLIDTLYEASQSYSSRYMPPEQGTFAAYEAYYSNLTWEELLSEVQSLSDSTAFNRVASMFQRLVELACTDQAVSADDRHRAACLSSVIEDQIRTTMPSDVIQRFDKAAQFHIDELLTYGCNFPEMAERIRSAAFSRLRRGHSPGFS